MEHYPSSEANIRTIGGEISRHLWNPKVRYRLSLDPNLSRN